MVPPGDPGPQTRVAGFRTVVSHSRVVPRDDPQAIHTLKVTLAFPDRARAHLTPRGGRPSERHVTYRFGERGWILEPRRAESRLLEGEERRAVLLELELRRAVTLWPDGFAWEQKEGQRVAESKGLGRLVASLPEGSERPGSVRAQAPDGRELVALTDLEWRAQEGRVWPLRMTLSRGGTAVWDEEVVALDTEARYLDREFVPHDRRPAGLRSTLQPVRGFQLPAMVVRRLPLPPGSTLRGGLRRAEDLAAREVEALAELGLSLDPTVHLELDGQARPVAVLLRLAGEATPGPPGGWTLLPPRPAVGRLLGGVGELGPGDLADLRRAAGKGVSGAGAPFLRVRPPGGSPRRAEIVLPLGG